MNSKAAPDTVRIEDLLEHKSWLERLARNLVLDDAQVEDLVQETWLAALKGRGRPVSDPRAWLGGVARNLMRTRSRTEATRRATEERAARNEATTSNAEDLAHLQQALIAQVLKLEESCRSALLARYFEGLPPRQIAVRQGESLATIKSRLARGLTQLRERLDREHGGRREWGLALLPLAKQESATWVAIAWGLAASLLVVAGVGWGVAALVVPSTATPNNHLDPIGASSDSDSSAMVATPSAGVAIAPTPQGVGENRVAVPTLGNVVELLVVLDETGEPASGARIRYVHSARLIDLDESEYDLLYDIEQLCARFGEVAETNRDGRAMLNVSGEAWLARITFDGLLATVNGRCEEPRAEARLRSVPWLRARVIDAHGRPQAGVPVVANLEERDDGSWDGSLSRLPFLRTTDDDGWVEYWDPSAHWTSTAVSKEDGAKMRWRSVQIDLPGVADFVSREGRGQHELSIGVDSPKVADAPQLLLPATAALDVIVSDLDGKPYKESGRVILSTPALSDSMRGPSSEAQLNDGHALFPRVALGLEFEAKIYLPDRGASWTTRGVGPAVAGETRELRTRREVRDVLEARLLNSEGAALGGAITQVHLLAGPERKHATMLGSATTSTNGVLAIDLKPEQRLHGGLSVLVYQDAEVLWTRGDLGSGIRVGGANLGELRLQRSRMQTIEGRCLTLSGEPVAGLNVTAANPLQGSNFGDTTDAAGRFQVRAALDGSTRVSCTDYRSTGGLISVEPFVMALPSDEELILHMEPGGVFSVNLSLPQTWPADQYLVGILKDRRVSGDEEVVFHEGGGHMKVSSLRTGTYDFDLRLGSQATLANVTNVAVRAGVDNRDARVDGLDLNVLLRQVRLRVVDSAGRDITSEAKSLVQLGRQDLLQIWGKPYLLLPREQEFRVSVSAPGFASQDLRVPDDAKEMTVVLSDGIEVELRILTQGASDSYELHSLSDSSATVALPRALIEAGGGRVRFPSTGSFRLIRQRETLIGEGMAETSIEPTKEVVEVLGVSDGQVLELHLDAPALGPDVDQSELQEADD